MNGMAGEQNSNEIAKRLPKNIYEANIPCS